MSVDDENNDGAYQEIPDKTELAWNRQLPGKLEDGVRPQVVFVSVGGNLSVSE